MDPDLDPESYGSYGSGSGFNLFGPNGSESDPDPSKKFGFGPRSIVIHIPTLEI